MWKRFFYLLHSVLNPVGIKTMHNNHLTIKICKCACDHYLFLWISLGVMTPALRNLEPKYFACQQALAFCLIVWFSLHCDRKGQNSSVSKFNVTEHSKLMRYVTTTVVAII